MALVLVRKNLNKFPSRLYYQASRKNFGISAAQHPINAKPCVTKQALLPKKMFNACKMIIRPGTTKTTITIKEYQTSRKYTGYWKVERLLGWALILMIPTAFAIESKEFEMTLGTVALMHTYLGCQSMCSDYVRSSVVGKVLPIIVRLFVAIISLSSLAGIYQLVYEDIGIVNMIKKFWAIRGRDYAPPRHLQKN